ncbi:CSC1-like protein 2, partial [Stegodyphus dumicola]|uniref:CSC1-like protein 2 n=1 Tax=Stegodyphus dumicola TaxID=202533 RepID=UPI0015A99C1C
MKRCGIDAIQYLSFLKHLIAYNIVNTVICLTCVLPANLQGDMTKSLFGCTTVGNLDPESPLLWIHVISSAFLSIVCYTLIRNYSRILNVCSKSKYADRTIIIKRLQEGICSSEKITEYFNKSLQKDAVEDVKLFYQYRPIITLNRKLSHLEEVLEVCNQIRNTEFREVMVKRQCWCCLYYFKIHCNCEQVNGIQYYTAQMNLYRKSIAKELNALPKKILPMAFVSFSQEHLTGKAKERQKRLEPTDPMRPCLIHPAPNPNNILWENMKHSERLWDIRTMTINTVVLLVALFLTTPAVIIASLDLDQLSNLSGNSVYGSIIFSKVLPTILAWSLSMSIYFLVSNSSQYLHFGTKSAMCRSIMKKTFSFLVLTVVVLPSLGLTSLSAFILWTVSEDNTKYSWG